MRISNSRFAGARAVAAVLAAACLISPVRAAEPSKDGYPRKPVRVLVGSPAGSGSDVMMRAIAVKLTDRWAQSVVVDNRAGATGAISIQLAAQAVPDGYTLATLSAQNVAGMALKTVTTDIPRELTPIVQMISQPYLLVVTPGLPVTTVKELIAYARGKPLVFASSGTGSVVHLGMELFKHMARVDMTHVPYKGSGQSMVDVMSGRVQLAITNTLTATPLVRSGRLRALAVTSARRVPAFPDLPTVAEAGVPGYELGSWYGLIGPAKLPDALVALLNQEVSRLMNTPEVREKLAADGAEAAAANTPAQFRRVITGELARWEKVVAALEIRQ